MSALGLLGCETVLDLADDPQVVETGPWRCLGKTTPKTPSKATALVRVRTCDFITNCATNVTAVTAKLCSKRDTGCKTPLQSDIRDMDGELRLEVPTTGFDGYLEISPKSKRCTDFSADSTSLLCLMAIQMQGCDLSLPNDSRCDIPTHAQSMLFFNPPVTADMTAPLEVPMLAMDNLPVLMKSAGVPNEALANLTGGNMFVTVRDCDGKPASGVTLSIPPQDNEVFQLYVASGLPTREAVETDGSGMGAFIGLAAPKFVEASAYTADGRLIGKIGVQTSALAMTYSTLPAQ